MALLFLHGAGGYAEDRPLADAIAAELGQPLTYPRFPEDDMSFRYQASLVRAALDTVDPDDLVAAHSFGASILLRVLAERERETPRRVVLLAMPDWSPQGWDVEDYAFAGPAPPQDMGVFARFRFEEEVQGPICLGYGSHFGLGFFLLHSNGTSTLWFRHRALIGRISRIGLMTL